jgi:hypothetical protein
MKTDTMLDMIRMLSSQGASGSLQINTGMTDGEVSFFRGQIVDARLGKMTGFQAINALASMRDITYNFEQALTPPTQTRITPNERMLLKNFFGIHPVEPDDEDVPLESWAEEDPRPVIPLSRVEAGHQPDSLSVEEQLNEPTMLGAPYQTPRDVGVIFKSDPEATLVKRRRGQSPLTNQQIARSVFVILVMLAIGVIAVVLVQRFRRHDATASVEPTAETVSPSPEARNDIPDLTGTWKVTNTIDQTSYQGYQNMEVAFNVSINQAGNAITGKGEKISENGRSLPTNGRTPIEMKGTVDGDKIEATFFENGRFRKTNGRFVWRIDKTSGGLTGTFITTAARSSGRSAATKVS